MGARSFFRSLAPGNDRQLAADQYAGRESASDEASRRRRERHRQLVAKEAAKTRKELRRDPRRR